MAKALDYPVAFKALLDGGHICEREPVVGAVKYTVHPGSGPLCLGHITERQLVELYRNNIIKPLRKQRTLDDGSVLTYWKLEGAEEDE